MPAPTTTERRHRFEALAKRAEQQLEREPRSYKRRLLWLALLGYGVIFSALLTVVLLIGGGIALASFSTAAFLILLKSKLIILLVPLAWVLLKSLWVRIEQPDGYRLERRDFPALFTELDALRSKLATPRIHRVLLGDELNASIIQVPRLGIFGLYRNTLTLGLPMLMAMSPEQLRAVLAHELGHLSSNHSRFNGWIYRARASWGRIMQAFDQAEHWATGLLRRFFNWYVPTFNAYSFALARANEYEADAISTQVTSPDQVALALIRVHLAEDAASKGFWQPLYDQAAVQAHPPAAAYAQLQGFFKTPLDKQGPLEAQIEPLLEAESDYRDTHPSLRERLAAVGRLHALPANALSTAPTQSAAEAWLGAGLSKVVADFDRDWRHSIDAPWQARNEQLGEQRREFDRLRGEPEAELADLDRWQLAALTEQLDPDRDPLPLYRAYQRVCPDDPDADMVIGRLLIERDDPAGLEQLERVFDSRPHAADAYNLAIGFLKRRGDEDAATRMLERGERYMDKEQAAQTERSGISKKDEFAAPDLPQNWIEHISAQLAATNKIKKAWIAHKRLQHFPEQPLYIIAIKVKRFNSPQKLIQQLVDGIHLPGETFFVATNGDRSGVSKKVRKVGVELI